MKNALTKIFGIDSRSLGFARIFLGFILVSDGITKLIHAKDFFTDGGILPRIPYVRDYLGNWAFSLHLASGELWFQLALISLGIFASFTFMVGYRWRFSAIVSFILLCSLQNRNTAILTAADDVVRLFLFWFMFLPSPGAFALDRLEAKPRLITGLASAALLTQLLIIYVFTAIWKWDPVYTQEFSAVYYSLNIDYFVKPFGVFLRQYLGVTKVLTIATVLLETIGPILVLIPFWPLRLATSLAFIFFHVGLFGTLSLGIFSGIMITYWLLFIPGETWEWRPLAKLEELLTSSFEWLGKKLPPPEPESLNPLLSFFARHKALELMSLTCLLLVIAINASGVTENPRLKLAESLEHVARSANIDQTWWMFAPRPTRSDGWIVVDAHYKDGRVLDLLTGRPPSQEKPERFPEIYNTKEWQTFMIRIWEDTSNVLSESYAYYLCDQHPDVKSLEVVYFEEYTPPMGKAFGPLEPHLLWSQECGEF